jgi:hypothetical protein
MIIVGPGETPEADKYVTVPVLSRKTDPVGYRDI